MRCRVGDLAFYVGGAEFGTDGVGKVVRILAPLVIPPADKWDHGWLVTPGVRIKGVVWTEIADSLLRPIRDGDESRHINRVRDFAEGAPHG